jgi:hypothetical protein
VKEIQKQARERRKNGAARIRQRLSAQERTAVNKALEFIDPRSNLRDECKWAIERVIDCIRNEIGIGEAEARPTTARGRNAVREVASALKALRTALNDEQLHPQYETMRRAIDIDRWLEFSKCMEARPARTANKKMKRRIAARKALRLMWTFARDVEVATAVTRGKAYCRLTGLLAGEPNADMQPVCRDAKKRFKRPASLTPTELHRIDEMEDWYALEQFAPETFDDDHSSGDLTPP